MSTDIANIWDGIAPLEAMDNWRDPAFSDKEHLLARDGFEGFYPETYQEIWHPDLMRTMMGDLSDVSNHRVINDPVNISNIDTKSQSEIDEALAPVLEKTIQHPTNSRILLANFNGAAIALRHSNVDAVIVKDCPKPSDMITESCEGQEIEFLIHETIRNVLQKTHPNASDDALNEELQRLSFRTILQGINKPEKFMIGLNVQAEISHLQKLFEYATGKKPTHHEAIIQATGPKSEKSLQGEWHFDRETIENELMIKAILEGRMLPEQKYLLIKTARGQDTQYSPEVLDRNEVLRWEKDKTTDHDAMAVEINAEDVIHNGILLTKVSLAGELLAQIQTHNDFVHRSPTVMRGFGRGSFALGG